jgi:flagellar basal-body rod protein FlgG
MILAELASSPASDRDVWYETLRELPPEDAVTILRLWKATHADTALPLSSVPPLPAPVIEKPAAVATTPKRVSVPHPEDSTAAGPRDICLHNLANAETPGFKRCEPHGGSVLDVGAKPDRVTPVAASIPAASDFRFDMSQGEIRESGAPFDLAIDGPGFFEIHLDGESLYTRCGRFVLNAERKLALRLSDGRFALLSPEVRIPDEAQSIQINRLGHVMMSVAEAEALQRVAEIPLCRFLDPSALDPAGQCLFKVSETSGPAWQASTTSGKGELVQGSFEASNVDANREKAILAVLPAAPLGPSQAVKSDARVAEEPAAEVVR